MSWDISVRIFIRPYGTFKLGIFNPTVKTVGYYRPSLRDVIEQKKYVPFTNAWRRNKLIKMNSDTNGITVNPRTHLATLF